MICERPSGQVVSLASPKTIVKSASYLVPERNGKTNPHLVYTLSRFLETDTRLVFDSTGRKEKLPKLHMRDLPIEASKPSGIPRSLAKLRPNYVEPPPRKATASRFLNPHIDSDVRMLSASPVMRRRDETTDRLGIGKISRSISSNEFIREAQRLNSSLSGMNHRSERDLKRHKQLQRSATTSKIAANQNQTFRISRPSSRNENEDGYSRMR